MNFPTLKLLTEAVATQDGAKVLDEYLQDEFYNDPDTTLNFFIDNGHHVLTHAEPLVTLRTVTPQGDHYVVTADIDGQDLEEFSPGDSFEGGEITGEEAVEVGVTFRVPSTLLSKIATRDMMDEDDQAELYQEVLDSAEGHQYKVLTKFNQTGTWERNGWDEHFNGGGDDEEDEDFEGGDDDEDR